jgi:colanic acid/amylovoran biosynthesis glycosyltransferase
MPSDTRRALKIAFFIQRFPVPSETFLLNWITGLIDRGHSVDIYSLEKGRILPVQPDFVSYGLRRRVNYLPHLSKAELGRLAEKRYDIVQACFGTGGLHVLKLRKEFGVLQGRLVTSFHGFDATRFAQENGAAVYSELFRAGELFLPVCDHFRDRLITMGCDPEKVRVQRTGIQIPRFSAGAQPGRWRILELLRPERAHPLRVLSVARLVEKKGLEHSIAAFALIADRYPNCEYQILGDGVLRARLTDQIRSLGLRRRVILRGWASQPEVIRWMGKSSVLVAPSITASNGNQEGIPNVLKEAMCLGIPVIASDHSGIPELVRDGVTGVLVPERSVESLAAALDGLLGSPDRRKALGVAASHFVRDNYDSDRLNEALVHRYLELLRSPAPPTWLPAN